MVGVVASGPNGMGRVARKWIFGACGGGRDVRITIEKFG